MGTVSANGVSIWFETFGDRAAPPILLVMGQGAQATGWPTEFCEGLAAIGRFVVRYDNRDTGFSTWFTDAEAYDLSDMAADAIGLLDALDIERAHVVGASLGGAIGQLIAIRWPERVATLVSIMSSMGRAADDPDGEATALLDRFERERLTDDDEAIRESVESWRLCAGTTRAFDEQWWYEFVREQHQRAPNPEANAHHRAAMLRSGSRRTALARIRARTLVIHGDEDPLAPLAAGAEVAQLISGAQLLVPGMGHELPPWTWDSLIPAIAKHTGANPEGAVS